MSEYADKHSKMERRNRVDHILNSTKPGRVDASDYKVPGEMHAEKKTGMQPKPRAFKRGGKVEGERAHHHAGRKSRDMGGQTAVQQLRPQVPTSGIYGNGFSPTKSGMLAGAAGLKKGGKACAKNKGGSVPGNNEVTGTRPTGGRLARAEGGGAMRAEDKFRKGDKVTDVYGKKDVVTDVRHPMVYTENAGKNTPGGGFHHTKVFKRTERAEGGRTKAKGKSNITIIIGSPKDQQQPPAGAVPPPPSAMPPAPPRPPGGLPPAAMGPMAGPGGMGGPPMPPPGGMPPPMPRANGGRT